MTKESDIRKKAIEQLRADGWITWFAPKVKFIQTDVFGIIDVLALRGKSKKNIQLTTLSNVSARRKKKSGQENVPDRRLSLDNIF